MGTHLAAVDCRCGAQRLLHERVTRFTLHRLPAGLGYDLLRVPCEPRIMDDASAGLQRAKGLSQKPH